MEAKKIKPMGKLRRYAYGAACGSIALIFTYRAFTDIDALVSSPAFLLIIFLTAVFLLASCNSFSYKSSRKISKSHGWIQVFSVLFALAFLLVAFIEISSSKINFSEEDWFFLAAGIILFIYMFIESRSFQKLAKVPPPLPCAGKQGSE